MGWEVKGAPNEVDLWSDQRLNKWDLLLFGTEWGRCAWPKKICDILVEKLILHHVGVRRLGKTSCMS
jgi:hypothetical protein